MKASTHRIREEFDRLALLSERHGGLSDTYHGFLIRQLPPYSESALEIGCGTGEFTRLLTIRARNVVGIDLSPQMVRVAKSQSTNYPNIQYLQGDITSLRLPAEGYDCIVSIATLHHLPLVETLEKMKDALKPKGVLLIHDLVAVDGYAEIFRSALAYPVSVARRLWRTGRIRIPRDVREAWDQHGKGETYLNLDAVREICRQYLPEARIHRHLLWRYTVVWHKRNESSG